MPTRHGPRGRLRLNGRNWHLVSTGTPTPTPTPVPTPTPTPTGPSAADATWFDIQPATGILAPNAAVQVTLTPRLGTWPATGTISLASSKSGAFGTITVPNGTQTPVVTNFIPTAAGYHLITATNTLGLKNPGYVGLSVFAADTGSAVTISQSTAQLAAIKDASIWERDCRGGRLGGAWSTGFNKGWARLDVPLTLSVSASSLWMRLYQADTGMTIVGANATQPGTGTLLQGPVQVTGSVPSGTSTVSMNIPAGMNYYYVELASEPTFANPYRIPKRLGAGQRIGMSTRSYLCVLTWGWDYFGFSNLPNYLTMAGNYGLASCYTSPPQSFGSDWVLNDGTPAANTSPGAMEICRLMSGALGVLTGIIGSAIQGGSLDNHLSTLGKLNTLGLVSNATNGLTKFSYFIFGERDTQMSDEQLAREYVAVGDWLETLAGCPIIKSFDILDNIHTGMNGSVLGGGYGRAQSVAIGLEQTRRDVVSAAPMPGTLVNAHSGMLDRVVTGRDIARALLSREDPAFGGTGGTNGVPRGPRFALTGGTRLPGSYTLTIPIEHRGGSAVVPIKAAFNGDLPPVTISTPSSVELKSIFTVRLRGEYHGYGRTAAMRTWFDEPKYGVAIKMDATTPIAIVNPSPGVSKLQITLASTTPGSITFNDNTTLPLADAQAFAVSYACDIPIGGIRTGDISGFDGITANGSSFWLTDDNNPEGVQFGHSMQRESVYYVEAPTPAAQSVSITPPPSTVPGGWLEIKGPPGTGPRATGLQFAFDGGTKAAPTWIQMRDDNSWQAALIAPATAGAHTVSVYRQGQNAPDDTENFTVRPAATLLGAGPDVAYMNLSSAAVSAYVESYSAHNRTAQWTDTGATQHPSAMLDTISRWDGDSGNVSNRLGLYHFSSDFGYPAINFNSLAVARYDGSSGSVATFSKYSQHIGIANEIGQALWGSCAPLTGQMGGDFTVASAHEAQTGGGSYWPWMLTIPGLSSGVGIADNGAGTSGTFMRGSNIINNASAPVNIKTLICCVLRYRVSDGLLEAFYLPLTGQSAISFSNTLAPAALTLAGLQVTPYFGNTYSLTFFNARLGGDLTTGDVGAMLTQLSNRWG